MPIVQRPVVIAALASWVLLTGCATTKVETTGSPPKEPLCQLGTHAVNTVVYWGPQWRPDQKEPPLREAAALRGIQDFLSRTSCLAVVGIHRVPAERLPPSNDELLHLAAAVSPKPERVLLIVVRELGPRLVIGIPGIVEGGTEVLIDVRVLSTRTSLSLADAQTLWRNGGAFVVKGVKTLDQDMSAALSATLMPTAAAK